jgi:C4-dicarboxylate-specific signal transduction histidine kinase
VERIIRDGKRAGEVIARIRALVRKTGTEKERLDLNEAIQEVGALVQDEVRKNRVALRLDVAADLPLVVGDRVQLQQVLLNLVMNGVEALAAVADRPRELLIRSRPQDSDTVLIAVQDSGMGIERENLNKLFAPFYTTKAQGMGMGLSISRSIVEDHGGRLWAAANDGPGTTFQFTLLQHH